MGLAYLDALSGVVEDVRVALHVVRGVLPVPLRAPRHAVAARAKERRVLVADTRICADSTQSLGWSALCGVGHTFAPEILAERIRTSGRTVVLARQSRRGRAGVRGGSESDQGDERREVHDGSYT